jgi:hypothetical protein
MCMAMVAKQLALLDDERIRKAFLLVDLEFCSKLIKRSKKKLI